MSANLCRALRDPNTCPLFGEEAANLIEVLQETLRFYANRDSYNSKLSNMDHCVLADRGKQARELLQSIATLDGRIVLSANGQDHHI